MMTSAQLMCRRLIQQIVVAAVLVDGLRECLALALAQRGRRP